MNKGVNKESEKKDMYQDFARELRKIESIKLRVM